MPVRQALKSGPHPARSIAGVAGIAYGAGLIAPGVIGGIANLFTLTASFALVVVLTAVVAAGAGVLRPPASVSASRQPS